MKVLLVDDEQKFAMMLAKRLALRDIDVDYVYTGEEALQKAQNNRYDVALLDVKMPGIGGIELKGKLKKTFPDIKIVFLTGHGSKKDFEAGISEGAEYLSKPPQIEELLELLQRLMP